MTTPAWDAAPEDTFEVWVRFWQTPDGAWHLTAKGTDTDLSRFHAMLDQALERMLDSLDVPV